MNKLKAVVEYAVEQGWAYRGLTEFESIKMEDNDGNPYVYLSIQDTDNILYHSVSLNALLFSHDFAKAVFGEEGKCEYNTCTNCGAYIDPGDNHVCWQYHLQAAVISENPIKYYYDYVKTKSK